MTPRDVHVATVRRRDEGVVLHIDITLDASALDAFCDLVESEFFPEIGVHQGFEDAVLLVHSEPAREVLSARLVIQFATEADRQAWVDSSEHARVWPLVQAAARSVSGTRFRPIVRYTPGPSYAEREHD